jgi:hypothetical protein
MVALGGSFSFTLEDSRNNKNCQLFQPYQDLLIPQDL